MTATLELHQLEARDKTCTRCELHEDCKVRCIPTTFLTAMKPNLRLGPNKAILIIGEAPGATEEKQDQPFVGKSGQTLRKLYIDFFKLDMKADVYLGNAVRCRPPGNRTPNKTMLRACHAFLLADVIQLQREYKEVLVLAVGGPAALATIGLSLKKAFHKQGDFTDWTHILSAVDTAILPDCTLPKPTRAFFTYHPAFVLREPSSGLAVKAHIQMLADYLDGELDYELPDQLDIAVAPMPPSLPLGRLSLDIETYGIVEGYPEQKYFHPHQSFLRDGIAKKDLVQTVGLTWRHPATIDWLYPSERGSGKIRNIDRPLQHAKFYMDDPKHRRRLWAWIDKCKKEPGFEFLLGQNIVFDLMYLRYAYKEARILLEDPLPIMDLMVLNYLHDESRPERSLKALAPLFRVSKYGDTRDKAGNYKRYDSPQNQELGQYNCQDTASTLRLAEKLMTEIKGFYGNETKKLSPFCMKWYSQLLWLIVWMSETGLQMDQPALQVLFDRNKKALDAILRAGRDLYDQPFRGVGSEKGKRAMMDDAVSILEVEGIPLPELELTDKKGLIKFSADNRNALMDVLFKEYPIYKQLKLFGAYQDVSGLMDRYLFPLLKGSGKKHDNQQSVLLGERAYPRWFPVPSQYEDQSEGGTRQARIVAKGPPCQTFPPSVKSTLTGRFRGGWLVWFDYSQIELRVAALLSNDPAMSQDFRDGVDAHQKVSQIMFGDDILQHPQYEGLYRQAGKKFNFRGLYRGGAKVAQNALMKGLGINLSLTEIGKIDSAFWLRHRTLREWQDDLVKVVQRKGFYELPLIGQSRLFLGGRRAKDKKLNEIVNLPVQAIAADIMLSAQYSLWSAFRQAHMKAVVPCNVYDAALIECPKLEIHRVRRVMAEVLPNPPFYQALCDELGRTLPLEYEVKEKRL